MASPKDDCRTTYHASKSSGKRDTDIINKIIIHDTEGGSAASVARYFASAGAKGSAHLVVDENACYRTLANTEIPWAAPGANTNGFHIEICGYASWTTDEWLDHRKTLERAAYKVAFHCHLFDCPPKWLTVADLKKGVRGVSSHANCTKAFGGSHTDPGPNFPTALFMGRVRTYWRELANV